MAPTDGPSSWANWREPTHSIFRPTTWWKNFLKLRRICSGLSKPHHEHEQRSSQTNVLHALHFTNYTLYTERERKTKVMAEAEQMNCDDAPGHGEASARLPWATARAAPAARGTSGTGAPASAPSGPPPPPRGRPPPATQQKKSPGEQVRSGLARHVASSLPACALGRARAHSASPWTREWSAVD